VEWFWLCDAHAGGAMSRFIRKLQFNNYIPLITYYDKRPVPELMQMVPLRLDMGLRLDQSRQDALRQRIEATICPHCGSEIQKVFEDEHKSFATDVYINVYACNSCGYWLLKNDNSLFPTRFATPFVKSFCPQRHVAALSTLAQEIKENPGKAYTLDTTQFEITVGTILKDYMNCEVMHVGKTGDGGIDLIVIASDDPVMVQVKRRTRGSKSEGVEVVKELFASMFAASANKGMLVTTAQKFTKGAKNWVHLPALKDRNYQIDLVNIDRLLDMIRANSNGENPVWKSAMEDVSDFPIKTIIEHHRKGDTFQSKKIAGFLMIEKTAKNGDSAKYLFAAEHRDRCWRIPAETWSEDAFNLENLDPVSMDNNLDLIKSSGFLELLRDIPAPLIDELVAEWLVADGESVVQWDF
jgi:hypothetical protein